MWLRANLISKYFSERKKSEVGKIKQVEEFQYTQEIEGEYNLSSVVPSK
jgi:hypothetical protein